ncbi:hypothetical protein ABPG75_001940 [Micractinium tetrahymenae]
MRRGAAGAALLAAALAVGCLVGAAAATTSPHWRDEERVPAAAASYQTPIVYAETNRGLKPSRLQAYGRTHYYQLAEHPIGTLVWFHGCSRSAKGFFPYDPKDCPECLGLPEDVSHTKQALAKGYTLLAMEPNDQRALCWSSSTKNGYVNDQPDAIAAITKFLLERGLADKPVYFAGASSGGTFALKLPATLYLAAKSAGALSLDQAAAMAEAFNGSAASVPDLAGALAAAASAGDGMLGVGGNATDRANATAAPFYLQAHGIITEVSTPTDFNAADSMGRLRWPNYPPTAFVTMERDLSGQHEAQTNVMFFTRNGVPSGTVMSPKRRIGPSYFSDRAPVISLEQSGRIVAALKQIGLIDKDGQLAANPKDDDKPGSVAYKWDTKLKQALPWVGSGALTLMSRPSLIRQALFVAYANHEHVSDYMTAGLAWLETNGRGDFTRMAQQLVVPGGNLTALTADRICPEDPGVETSSDRSPPPLPRPQPSPPSPSLPSPPPKRSPPSPQPPSPPPRRLPSPPPSSPPPSPAPSSQPPPPAVTAPWPQGSAGAPPPWWTSAAVFFQQGQPASPPRPPSPPPSPPSPAPRPPWPPANGPTTPLQTGCRDKRCTSCSADGAVCSACLKGFRPNAEGVCVLACADPRCLECKFHPRWCRRCVAGFKVSLGECVAA